MLVRLLVAHKSVGDVHTRQAQPKGGKGYTCGATIPATSQE